MDFIKGIITGFILSVPFGPIGIYCMELMLVEGRWKGYATALGMVTIDVLYSLVALFFITNMDEFIIRYECVLSILIGIFLIAVATKKLKSKIEIKEVDVEFESIFKNYFIGIVLALANVSTILIITVIFSILKIYRSDDNLLSLYIALGVGVGGTFLWYITSAVISHFKNFMRKERLVYFVKISNVLILLFGIFAVISNLIKCFNT